jgi:recombination protein RecA
VRAKVVKNKVAAPFQSAEFDIMFNGGISTEGDLLDLAVNEGIAEKMGAWFSYGQVRLGQGRENAKQFLAENPDLAAEIRKAVLVKRGILKPEEQTAGKAKDAREAKDTKDAKAETPRRDEPKPNGKLTAETKTDAKPVAAVGGRGRK